MSDGDGFLSRWSRRKAAQRAGEPEQPTPPAPPRPAGPPVDAIAAPAPMPQVAPAPVAPPPAEPARPAPRMEDVEQLTPASDFARFVKSDVDPGVQNAALKKLFADPRFNVIDEMDTDIMDYSKLEPLPASMLRRMAQAHVLGLFRDEEEDGARAARPAPAPITPTATAPAVAVNESPNPDEDPDLRLQPDDAAGRAGDRPRPDEDPGGER